MTTEDLGCHHYRAIAWYSACKKGQDPLRGRIAFGGKMSRIKKAKFILFILPLAILLIMSLLYEQRMSRNSSCNRPEGTQDFCFNGSIFQLFWRGYYSKTIGPRQNSWKSELLKRKDWVSFNWKHYTVRNSRIGFWMGSKRLKSNKKKGVVLTPIQPPFFYLI